MYQILTAQSVVLETEERSDLGAERDRLGSTIEHPPTGADQRSVVVLPARAGELE